MIRRKPAVAAVLLVVLALSSAPSAGAQSTTDPDRPPETSTLMGAGNEGGISTQALQPNPAGCYGQSDDPHPSKTSGYTQVAAYGWTVCPVQQPHQYVNAALYKEHWYGGWYELMGEASNYNQFIAYGKVRAVAAGACDGDWTYALFSYHEVHMGGVTYSGDTFNERKFSC